MDVMQALTLPEFGLGACPYEEPLVDGSCALAVRAVRAWMG
jgi:hypothetical protein